jgi:hypothetical protein
MRVKFKLRQLRPPQSIIYLFAFLFLFNYSCKKAIKEDVKADNKTVTGLQQRDPGGGSAACREELEPDWYVDSVLTQTILGFQLIGNPYSVGNMQQASINLYGNTNGITANKKYVRFRPMNEEQTQILQESELNLFDYPLDREVLEEGDYYLQPGMTEQDYPWLYTMVDMDYQPPAGITYEVLQTVYVPAIDIWLENEAFRITGNPVNDSCGVVPNLLTPPCEIDPCGPTCDPAGCGGGPPGGGGGGGSDIKKPAGLIEVWDSNFGINVPVRQTRVVARRWFKVDAVYTNDQGRYQCTKRFKNKVNIFIKFLNNNIHVSRLMGNPVSHSLFPIKRGIGIYSGNLNNINFVFARGNSVFSRTYRHWWAAQLMNAQLEYNAMAAGQTIGQLSFGKLRVALTRFGFLQGGGATPMNSHRAWSGYPTSDYIKYYFSMPVSPDAALIYNALFNGQLFRFMDMGLGYRTDVLWTSNQVKDLMYHEMTHAALFAKVGEAWHNDLVYSESFTINKYVLQPANQPYGLGDDGTISDIISVGESWAEHVAQVFCNIRYGALNTTVKIKQGTGYSIDFPVIALGAHLNAIEDFSPNRPNDPFRWIPEGIYNDMIDNRNDLVVYNGPIDDNVFGYTNQQLFQALGPIVKSMPQYRARVLIENNNNQSPQVIQLFGLYNY